MGKLDVFNDRIDPPIADDPVVDAVVSAANPPSGTLAVALGKNAMEQAIDEAAATTSAAIAARKVIEKESDDALLKEVALMVRRGTEESPAPPSPSKPKGGASAIRTIPELLGRPKADRDTPAGRTYDYPFARLADQKIAVVALKINDLDATVSAILAIANERGWRPLAVFGDDAAARAKLIEMAFEREIPLSLKDPQDIAFLDRLRERQSAAPAQKMKG